ncbi:NAD-dependent epimerase/dehydratase family protein [Flavihumibacter fluvii]|uniref:NAD-dependent epimerase/dehydratase family protein n=1 Tax=Flavihumibacter fluvii TaxID=2838157 RepID=UPI001BDF159D|nr:epimerase [Flavihumibacter fluvii]ULQ52727.1 epimerase [Flavihumibacter fluvii]
MIGSIKEQYQALLRPSDVLVNDMKAIEGDIILLGVGGKMGPALARLAKQAVDKAGVQKRIIGISRFSEAGLEEELQQAGIETISADLLNEKDLKSLPDAKNIIYLAGTKFGTTGNESFTWAINSYLPGRVAEKYHSSNIVVFSTGNIYPLTSVSGGGASEDLAPQPIGEYAQSCLGRERIFQHFGLKNNTPLLIYRLNYANDVSYGVLLEIAKAVMAEKPIDLAMGNVNVIWQGDANEIAIRCLLHCSVPSKILNVTGPETLSVRWLANQFGVLFGKSPIFVNDEQPTALLSNASESFRIFGYPHIPLKTMMNLLVGWLNEGGKTINKETHFQERKGQF